MRAFVVTVKRMAREDDNNHPWSPGALAHGEHSHADRVVGPLWLGSFRNRIRDKAFVPERACVVDGSIDSMRLTLRKRN